VANVQDLEIISSSGFDGAIISTAVHRGIVPVDWIRRGYCC
jgi:phosphoribosylformimino-5-aminoimidazole carboxamide ribotide isomerase